MLSMCFILQVPRPKALCKDTIQTRNRKPQGSEKTKKPKTKSKSSSSTSLNSNSSSSVSPISLSGSNTDMTPIYTSSDCMLQYNPTTVSATHYPPVTPPISQYSPPTCTSNMQDQGYCLPTTCSSYTYPSPHDVQTSPQSYYSSPQGGIPIAVDNALSAPDSQYYYPYCISPSSSHPQMSPLSSQHSSPLLNQSPSVHTPPTMQSPVM